MKWREYDLDAVDDLAGLPTMLGIEERQFLYHLGRDVYGGEGEIVDLGAFLGGSAASFAAGLQRNPRVTSKRERIHSFDSFEFAHFHRSFLPDFPGPIGASTLPEFTRITGRYAEMIKPVAGDICRQAWAAPIEILFVDFTQTWAHHDAVADRFYRHMIPGRSVLIHQDYIYVICYWLHAFMEYYAEFFERIESHVRWSSAAWRLVEALPDEACSVPLYRRLPPRKIEDLIDRSIARYEPQFRGADSAFLVVLHCAKCRFMWHFHGKSAAYEEIARLGLDPNEPHVAQLIANIRSGPEELHDGLDPGRALLA